MRLRSLLKVLSGSAGVCVTAIAGDVTWPTTSSLCLHVSPNGVPRTSPVPTPKRRLRESQRVPAVRSKVIQIVFPRCGSGEMRPLSWKPTFSSTRIDAEVPVGDRIRRTSRAQVEPIGEQLGGHRHERRHEVNATEAGAHRMESTRCRGHGAPETHGMSVAHRTPEHRRRAASS